MCETTITFYNDCKEKSQSFESSLDCNYYNHVSDVSLMYNIFAYGANYEDSYNQLITHIDTMIGLLNDQKQKLIDNKQYFEQRLKFDNRVQLTID